MGQKTERMEQLISVAKKMWVGTDILAVQTGWEDSAIPPSAGEIAKGVTPPRQNHFVLSILHRLKKNWLSLISILSEMVY